MASVSVPSTRSRRLRRGLLATVVAAGVLVVPVTLAGPASAAPCPVLPLPLPIPLPCLATPAATSPAVITGETKIGRTIKASEPQWDQSGVTTTFQWLRDGADIADATTASYALTGDDFGTTIMVRATGTNSLMLPGTSDSAAVEPEMGDAITPVTRPVVTGSTAVGGTLTTTDGTWGEPVPTFEYQWYRSRPSGSGSQRIEGAGTASYSPIAADAGRKIVAIVVAERIGYAKGAGLSNVVIVPKAVSTTALALLKRTVRTSQSAQVRVTLSSSAGIVPTGFVAIFDGVRRLRTFAFAMPANGVATFNIKRLARGTHRLTARYAGDNAHAGSVSPVQVLTVTK
jgi:hypothetical protein